MLFVTYQSLSGKVRRQTAAKLKKIVPGGAWAAILWFCCLAQSISAQYAQVQFPVRVEQDIYYATAENHATCRVDLYMDLYKPVNTDLARPLLVLLHGGIFVNGAKRDLAIQYTAKAMASRGYVVACIDYREGWLLSNQASGTCPTSCWGAKHVPCQAFAADTAEVIRALYRAMQDAKTAIRWLKNRRSLDSTDCNRVFVGGHSFGGSAALMAGFLDKPGERPAETFALPSPPVPYYPPAGCNRYNPCLSPNLARPNLGDINGNLYTDIGYDAQVAGVLSFSGGIPKLKMLENGLKAPILYVFHQLCDHVIPNSGGRLLNSVDACLESCCAQPACRALTGMPSLFGGDAMLDYIESRPVLGILHRDDVVVNGRSISPEFGCTGGMGGIPFCTNPNYRYCHDFLFNEWRMNYMATFLAANMPPPSCFVSAVGSVADIPLILFPNPATDQLHHSAQLPLESVNLYNSDGQVLHRWPVMYPGTSYPIDFLPAGIYWLRFQINGRSGARKFVKVR